MPCRSTSGFFICLFSLAAFSTQAQTLSLKDAVELALRNYGTLKAKSNYALASKETILQARRDYLPNFTLSAQQDYGTINGQNGPLYGLGGLSASPSGPALSKQNWHAAFGALYLANINWDVFTFGRTRGRVKVAKATYERDRRDLEQEMFQHEVRVSSAYLNLLAAQRLSRSQEKNLERSGTFLNTALVRAKNGLIAGVDTSLANAEVSSARIALMNAKNFEQTQANELGVLMGVTATSFVLDTLSVTRIPHLFPTDSVVPTQHPALLYYQNSVEVSKEQTNQYRRLYYPSFSLFGVMQGRGSGFEYDYPLDQSLYSGRYLDGINPVRGNYLIGAGLTWNLTTLLRNHPQVKSQHYITEGLKNEYDMVDQQLESQLALAEERIKNAMANYREAPVQVKAASDAYLQKSTLYKNGLTTLVDLTQAIYALNRAETDRDIAYNNVWQALLLKCAALGDYDLFINEF
ncbi:Outer membrane protein-like protein [Arcticibacter svalbardensis MN12-7]|uniref:Outer membrane protein-like protein n=1 Tax=Arcticibacter svalbardensis MN12-7 TaxID=1150600 RepID=R9GQX7_9SPHI|nr:TolC family protein [Arcticibacter svalbardensis]EOR94103.1 Outer membrane protein-like protein [Arcticibacter svalbardensis MN12-7]